MTISQIQSAVDNHSQLKDDYYKYFLWGGHPIKHRPSAQDISDIQRVYSTVMPGHKMHADYAEKIAIAELNMSHPQSSGPLTTGGGSTARSFPLYSREQ